MVDYWNSEYAVFSPEHKLHFSTMRSRRVGNRYAVCTRCTKLISVRRSGVDRYLGLHRADAKKRKTKCKTQTASSIKKLVYFEIIVLFMLKRLSDNTLIEELLLIEVVYEVERSADDQSMSLGEATFDTRKKEIYYVC